MLRPRAEGQNATLLVSTHIPKCGGTSFQHVLLGIYGRRMTWLNYDPRFDPAVGTAEARDWPAPWPGLRCIHGHFRSTAFDQCGRRVAGVIWLRHPVQRVVSHYYHFLRHPEPAHPCYRALIERRLSLGDFAALEPMRDVMSLYLGGKPLETFRFVGVVERFAVCLRSFGQVFRVPVPTCPPVENANPERTFDTYPISERLHDRILALNSSDASLYAQALARLERTAA